MNSKHFKKRLKLCKLYHHYKNLSRKMENLKYFVPFLPSQLNEGQRKTYKMGFCLCLETSHSSVKETTSKKMISMRSGSVSLMSRSKKDRMYLNGVRNYFFTIELIKIYLFRQCR